jgi:pyrrolidone-carboxylate peptidase
VILLTGFEPFDGRSINRSWEAVSAVAPREGLERMRLPVDFAKLASIIPECIARRPRAVLLVGETPTDKLAVETIALNVIHDRRADNAGRRIVWSSVRNERPLALPATWNATAVANAIESAGVPVEISHHAGTYACNAALYHALDAAAQASLLAPIGFLHVPVAGMAIEPLARAIEAALDSL